MDKKLTCSFCGATALQVTHLIKGIDSYICDGCVEQCQEVIAEQQKTKKKEAAKITGKTVRKHLTPKQITAYLDEFVIGQSEAKKALAVALYNHYKRIDHAKKDVNIQKSNILMIGPTGSGKTYLVQHLAKMFEVPYTIADATTLTSAGYVGDDVDMILGRLVAAASGDVKQAERGIIYIDEIDKLAASGQNNDVGGEGVQQALLKIMEGATMHVNPSGGKKGPQTDTVALNTENILFICAGAFSGITDTTHKKRQRMGIMNHEEEDEKQVKKIRSKEIVKYGMIPEFIGRLPVFVRLHALKPEDLVQIMTKPKNSLVKQYKELFHLENVEVEFTNEFLTKIAEQAHKEGTGARGLRSFLEDALHNDMYETPGSDVAKVIVDVDGSKVIKAVKEDADGKV